MISSASGALALSDKYEKPALSFDCSPVVVQMKVGFADPVLRVGSQLVLRVRF